MLADNGFPPVVSDVVPTDSRFLPTTRGVVPAVCGLPPQASHEARVGQSVQCARKASAVSAARVEPGAVRARPLVAAPGVQKTDMSVFTDVRLMDGQDDALFTDFFPALLNAAAAQALSVTDWHELNVGNVGMTAAAALAPCRRPFAVGKPTKSVDINHVRVSSSHLNERLMRETPKQHGVTLTGVLQPSGGCLEAKGVRAGLPRRTTSRAGKLVATVHIDLAGPYEASVGGSVYLITFVDSASRWMRPYGMRKKSETTTYVRKFVADMNNMERPHCFRTDNGGEFISRDYVEFCDSAGIRREYTAPGKPQQNAVVESAIWRAMKGGHAARREIRRMFLGVDLGRIPNLGANRNRPWLEAVLWAADCFTRSATKANTGWRSPYEVFFSRLPALKVVPFFHEGMMRVDRSTNSDVQSEVCFFF